jgi:redox-sensitive bicupin YhaK (pirin superfamily)
LGAAAGPATGPWPLTVAHLSLEAGKTTTLPIASSERSFVYVVRGAAELGRNQVHLGQDSTAWMERTVGPDRIDSLYTHAAKDTQLLLFSSPVIGEDASGDKSADCNSDVVDSAKAAAITTHEART